MTSTFRLTRAEFKKIFKKPGVFIMALMLVVTIFVSLYIFQPNTLVEEGLVDFGNTYSTSQSYYDQFYSSTDTQFTKISIDNNFNNTDNIIEYYQSSFDRDRNIDIYYKDMVDCVEAIRNATDNAQRNIEYDKLKNPTTGHLKRLQETILNFSSINAPHVEFSQGYQPYEYNSTKYLEEFINLTKNYSATEIIEAYDANNYKENIGINVNYAKNYIPLTISEKAKTIKLAYDNYNTAYRHGNGNSNDQNIYSKGHLLYVAVKEFETYFKTITDNDSYPIVLINDSQKQEIMTEIEMSILALFQYENSNRTNNLPQPKPIKEKIDEIKLVNYFTELFELKTDKFDLSNTCIKQVKLNSETLDDLQKVQEKVNKNKLVILEDISKLRSDESIVNIQSKMTEYNLLNISYNRYVSDDVIISLKKDYNSSEFKQLYGYKLSEFNDYEYQERISNNRYFISNNVYSNSFNTNFTFNQNSAKNTTGFDFMYFTMELCAIIITIFAMMLMCNLITSETESGTIKLLLTRPYKRSKIISAKLLATIFFVIVFLIFSGLISFAGGYFIYGYDPTPILVTFNAKTSFAISPILLMIIDMISLLIDILFYVFLSLMISILIKNYAGSITVCLVIMIVTYVLNLLFPMAFWYSLLPSMNLHLFKYFGNGFTSIATESTFQNLLITPIQNTMSFTFSILLIIAYTAISLAVSYAVFNKRDF